MIHTFESYVFKADDEKDNDTFLVPKYVVDRCIENGNNLLVLKENYHREDAQITLSPFDLAIDKQEIEKSNKYRFKFDQTRYRILWTNTPNSLTTDEINLLKRFHWSWFNELRNYITSDEFLDTISYINNLRDTKVIYPSLENVFRAFKETNFDFVKCCVLGQDPYPNINAKGIPYANGIAFAVDTEDKPLSLFELERAIKKDMNYPNEFKLQNNLQHLIDQNVLLINSALTVEKNKAGIHSKLWRKFIELVITKLEQKSNVVFLLLGAEAKTFSKFAKNNIITASHPASAGYNNTIWNSFGAFKEASDLSNELNGVGIKWII